MKYSHYRFKFYLNANHAIYLNGKLGQNHPHTWEFSLETIKIQHDFVQFNYIEKEIEKYFASWQDKDINKISPFDIINPTLENICIYFKKELSAKLMENGWFLSRIEVSETPTRSYIIDVSDEVDTMSKINEENVIDDSVDKKLKMVVGK